MLRVELPLIAARLAPSTRSRSTGRETVIEVGAPAAVPATSRSAARPQLPQRVGVLPLRDTVTFPDMLIPLNVGQERSIELINDVLRGDRSIVDGRQRNPEVECPVPRTCTRWECSASWRG